MMTQSPQVSAGISVPMIVKRPDGGYDSAPYDDGHIFDYCGGCRLIWPSDLVVYDSGPDDWFCPLCLL